MREPPLTRNPIFQNVDNQPAPQPQIQAQLAPQPQFQAQLAPQPQFQAQLPQQQFRTVNSNPVDSNPLKLQASNVAQVM